MTPQRTPSRPPRVDTCLSEGSRFFGPLSVVVPFSHGTHSVAPVRGAYVPGWQTAYGVRMRGTVCEHTYTVVDVVVESFVGPGVIDVPASGTCGAGIPTDVGEPVQRERKESSFGA